MTYWIVGAFLLHLILKNPNSIKIEREVTPCLENEREE
jgi:hypothetical protein